MTREEAIKKLKNFADHAYPNEEFLMAIEALEQELCEDCISRESLMHILDEVGGDFDSPREAVVPIDYIADMVSELPSITPQPKVGQWEWVQYDANPNIGNWHCSECRTIIPDMPEETDHTPIYKWCPMCGSRMIQEAKNNENDM